MEGKGEFPLSEPLPEKLIEDIVNFRIAENAGRPSLGIDRLPYLRYGA